MEQTDVAVTLALSLGVPIPQNSLGVLLPEPLDMLSPRDRLKLAFVNAQQLLKVFKQNRPQHESGKGEGNGYSTESLLSAIL